MNLEEARDALLQAIDAQEQAEVDALNTQDLLAQQQIMYANEASGTLYSGTPTWQRAQQAAETASNLAQTRSNYLGKRVDTWNTFSNYIDQINAYNEAAAKLAGAETTTSTEQAKKSSFLDFYNQLRNGQ